MLSIDIGTSKLAQGNCGDTIMSDVEKFTGASGGDDVAALANPLAITRPE